MTAVEEMQMLGRVRGCQDWGHEWMILGTFLMEERRLRCGMPSCGTVVR